MSKSQFQYITYGPKSTASEVSLMISHHIEILKRDGTATPMCIWGTHGIGKTDLVKEYALDNGFGFSYVAPAQFEEMGDLLGLPTKDMENNITKFLPPEWVPREEGPGILLIDDVNRADDRILRGIMQLLQNNELVSWKLPSKWMIVLTANPDGGDYSVTTMDDAFLTRLSHATMEFDVKEWAKWAERAGVDERGIAFVLAYPEVINNKRTTPRTLVLFFKAIQHIPNLKSSLKLVQLLAASHLEEETAAAFINYINMDLEILVSSFEILHAKNFNPVEKKLEALVKGNPPRLDILSVIITRLIHSIIYYKKDINPETINNIIKFILLPFIPNDLRISMGQDIIKSKRKDISRIYTHPEIGKLILANM